MKKISIYLISFLMILFCFSINCYASEFPPNVNVEEQHYKYVFFALDSGQHYFVVFASDNYDALKATEFWYANSNRQLNYKVGTNSITQYIYRGPNAESLTLFKTQELANGASSYVAQNISEIKASNFDIYGDNGEIFFQGPLVVGKTTLLEETMKMIAEETPQAGTQILKTAKIILIAAVSCLVLLISLVILSKVLRTYLMH